MEHSLPSIVFPFSLEDNHSGIPPVIFIHEIKSNLGQRCLTSTLTYHTVCTIITDIEGKNGN